jgi:hypothetical protein
MYILTSNFIQDNRRRFEERQAKKMQEDAAAKKFQ